MPQTQKEENTIKFNYMMGGELINIKYRDGRKNFKLYKGAEKIFYNIDSIDYLDNCIDYFEDKEKVILAVDNDEAGNALKQELIRRLGAEVCYLVDFADCKDANEYLTKHGKDALQSAIHTCKPVPLEGVSTLYDIEDGIPSSGKSDFVDQMVVGYNQNYGWKTAFASPENQPTYLHAHKLMRKVWQDMPRPSDIGGDSWNRVADHVNDNFFFIDMDRYTLDAVLKKGAELVKRKGIKCLVIDPFNKIRDINAGTDDVNRYTMEYLTKIETFCIEEPTMYSIKGGGEWYDASYHGILVHRDYEAKTVKAKVLKVKFQNLGENQAEAHFKWEPKSGCFIPQIVDTIVEDALPWES